MGELTIEQKIIKNLANLRFLNCVGDVTLALKDPKYAELLLDGLMLDKWEDVEVGDEDCDHEALSNEEIQIVFDNDEE